MDEYNTFNAPDNPQNNDLLEHDAKIASKDSAMDGGAVRGNFSSVKQTKSLTKEDKFQKKKDTKGQNRRRIKKTPSNMSKEIVRAKSKLSLGAVVLLKKVNDDKRWIIFKERIKTLKKLYLIRRRIVNAIFKRKNELKNKYINTKKKIFNFKNFLMNQQKTLQAHQQNIHRKQNK